MNRNTGRIMALLKNQQGVINVGLTKDKIQHKRSVACLVSEAFNPRHPLYSSFNAPIHLNGDPLDNRSINLMWRPKWFAMKYAEQFKEGPAAILTPIQDVASKEIFQTSWDAALTYGLLDKEILLAILNRTYVWPTYQTFHVLPIKTDIRS